MLGMGVFKQLIKELYEWLLHSIDEMWLRSI